MKHKLFYILMSGFWLLCLLALGCWYAFFCPRGFLESESENRALADVPELSLSAFLNGTLDDAVEDWLSDRFPARERVMQLYQGFLDTAGFATYDEELQIAHVEDATAVEETDEAELDALISVFEQPASEEAPEEETEVPAAAEPEDTESALPEEAQEEAAPEPEEEPEEAAVPPDPADYPDYFQFHIAYENFASNPFTYSKKSVLATAAVLNRIAAVLPEDGQVVYTMIPDSIIGNTYFGKPGGTAFGSDAEKVVDDFSAKNVTSITGTDYLKAAMDNGVYCYYRSDYHWTAYGAYEVYKPMAEAAGQTPADFSAFSLYEEEDFLGSYYRDHPSGTMRNNPDTLTIVIPPYSVEWRCITGKDTYEVRPTIDLDAKKNDRYTVNLGGPGGPWRYAVCDNGIERNCLLITDSYGLPMIPMFCMNYGQVHYCDARYFVQNTVGCSVKEMIEKYNISDVYVIVGSSDAYNSGFLTSNLSAFLGD